MRNTIRAAAAAVLAGSLAGAPALVAAAGPPDGFRPSASGESHITTETSQVLPKWTPSAGLVTGYGQTLHPDSRVTSGSLSSRATSHLVGALGLFGHAELGLALPMILFQRGSNGVGADRSDLAASAFGDLRIGAKGTILRTPNRGFGLGLAFDVTAPTGRVADFTGEGGVTYAPQLLMEQRMARGMEAALNLGYLARPDRTIDRLAIGDSVTYRAAFRVPLGRSKQFALATEMDGAFGVRSGAPNPLVMRGGMRWRMRSGLVLGLYAGGAPVAMFGMPDVHGLMSVAWVPPHKIGAERAFAGSPRPSATAMARRYERALAFATPAPAEPAARPDDADRDVVLAAADLCPSVAEDRDGFEDDDGCPEHDNDRDGLRDAVDLCPSQPELVNGWADWDGCPDVRLADGTGATGKQFDPSTVVPELRFRAGRAELTDEDRRALVRLAELARLNPWIGTLEIRVPIGAGAGPQDLGTRRGESVRGFLLAQGLDPFRVDVRARPSDDGTLGAVTLAVRTADGLRPLAPGNDTLERLVTEAAARSRTSAAQTPSSVAAQGPAGTSAAPVEPAPR